MTSKGKRQRAESILGELVQLQRFNQLLKSCTMKHATQSNISDYGYPRENKTSNKSFFLIVLLDIMFILALIINKWFLDTT